MFSVTLLEVLLLSLVAGLLAWAAGVGRGLPRAQVEQARRLDGALAEIRFQADSRPHLREPVRQVRQYGRDLEGLLPRLAELERFLAKPGLASPTRADLLARHRELEHTFEAGAAYLERLGAELVLTNKGQEPPALAELPGFLIELREVLHPRAPHQG